MGQGWGGGWLPFFQVGTKISWITSFMSFTTYSETGHVHHFVKRGKGN